MASIPNKIPKSPNSILEGKIEEMVNECLALRKRKLADLYEQKTAQCSLSYLIRHLLRVGKYNNLVEALKSEDPNTDCVLLPRTVDGRIFINGKKYDAQTYFCRLWRFPNLKTRNHLQSNSNCLNAMNDDVGLENMCVNPYHFSKPLPTPNPRKSTPKNKMTNPVKSPMKTIIVKKRSNIPGGGKEIKRKFPEDHVETIPVTTTHMETDDSMPTSFKVEARDHPKNLGTSMRKLSEEFDNWNFHQDTELFCSDGIMKQNRLLVGLAFPELKTVEAFCLPISSTVFLPDFTLANIRTMFNLILGALSDDQDSKQNIDLFENFNVPDVMEESMEVGKPLNKQLFTPVDSQQGFLGFVEEDCKKKIKLEPDVETFVDAEQFITMTPTVEKVESVVVEKKQDEKTKKDIEKPVETDTYCFHCKKEFHHKNLYEQHLNQKDHLQYFADSQFHVFLTPEDKKKWKCDFCSEVFDTKVTWSAHFTKSGCGKQCEHCSQKFVTTYLWNIHLQRSSCGESQKEKIKQDIFKNAEFQKCLKDAYNNKGKESFACQLCNEIFKTFQALFVHNRKSHRDHPIKHISLGHLQNLKSTSEVKEVPTIKVAKPVVIHRVGDILNKSPNGGKILETQKTNSTGKISLINIKHNIERLREDVTDASNTNKGEKEKKPTENHAQGSTKMTMNHECLFCGKVFTAAGFENHQSICKTKGACELYKKNFMTQTAAQTNPRQPIQTFPCQYCEKKFTTEDFLMFHIKKFHPSKQITTNANVCKHCKKLFSSEQELKMHQVMTTECAHLIDATEFVKKEINDDDEDMEKEKREVLDITSTIEEHIEEESDDTPNVNMNYVDDEILNE